jgi:uncharacterized glyoxalase superfamily protein PhnB
LQIKVITAHTILFVDDQAASTDFYSSVLDVEPDLNVPGMTEFHISPGAVLGLMPRASADRLFAGAVKIADEKTKIYSVELYLLVDDAAIYFQRAIDAGAQELSPLTTRDWGHRAGYCLDPDMHLIAFAETLGKI